MRFDVDGQVNVRFSAADAVEVNGIGLAAAVFDQFPNNGLNIRLQSGAVVFDMPVQVEINLMEHMAGHGWFLEAG
jgi:hypothetical protein